MQALKGLVYGMGVLIVIAFILLGFGFYMRITNPDFRLFKGRDATVATSPEPHDAATGAALPAATPLPPATPLPAAEPLPAATPLPAAGAQGFGDVVVQLPAGCTPIEMHPDGPLLYLRTGPAGTCARIWLIEVRTGRLLGSLRFEP
ncbi:MAG: hypothetical protein P9C48_01940 [Defluviicoccus sp.]|nr:hypothetical protein [Defluviicoccus sp.]MDG4607875.1 hypothetical protein [Defluviicoccus sp.]